MQLNLKKENEHWLPIAIASNTILTGKWQGHPHRYYMIIIFLKDISIGRYLLKIRGAQRKMRNAILYRKL